LFAEISFIGANVHGVKGICKFLGKIGVAPGQLLAWQGKEVLAFRAQLKDILVGSGDSTFLQRASPSPTSLASVARTSSFPPAKIESAPDLG
jgi:hypothetical protein